MGPDFELGILSRPHISSHIHECIFLQVAASGSASQCSGALPQLLAALRQTKSSLVKGSTAHAALSLLIEAGHKEVQTGADLTGAVTWLSAVGDAFSAAARTVKVAIALGQLDLENTPNSGTSDAMNFAIERSQRALSQEFRHCLAPSRNGNTGNKMGQVRSCLCACPSAFSTACFSTGHHVRLAEQRLVLKQASAVESMTCMLGREMHAMPNV